MYGGSLIPPKKIIFFFRNSVKNYLFVLGPQVSEKSIKYFQKNRINYIHNPNNLFKIIKSAKYIFTRYGVSMYEIIALRKKPIIFLNNENLMRKKEILYLKSKNLVNIFDFKNINLDYKSKSSFKINLNNKKIIFLFKRMFIK